MRWHDYRSCIASIDVYTPPHPALKLFMKFANRKLSIRTVHLLKVSIVYERFHSGWLRKRALTFMYEYICMEDEHTDFIDIGPVSKCINMLCRFANEGPESVAFRRHARRIGDYIWLAEDGMKMQVWYQLLNIGPLRNDDIGRVTMAVSSGTPLGLVLPSPNRGYHKSSSAAQWASIVIWR